MPQRMKRIVLLILILYITFVGGTATPELYLFHRVLFQIVVTLIFVFWGIRMLSQRRTLPQTPFDLLIVTIVLWLFMNSLFSWDTRLSLETIWTFLLHIALFYLMLETIQLGKQRWLFEGLYIAGGLIIMFSLLELVGWYFGLGFGGFKQGWFEIGNFSNLSPPMFHRLSLVFGFSTILSNYIALLIPVILAWALTVEQHDYRISFFLLLAGLLVVQFLTFSRGGWLGTAVGLGVFILFWFRRSYRQKLKISPRLLGITIFIASTVVVLSIILLSTQNSRDLGDRGRTDMWTSALEMMKDKPLTGYGVRQFGVVFREYRDPTIVQDKLAAAHNLWLNTSAELGIPGLLLLLGLGIIFLRTWFTEWQQASPHRQIRFEGILAALIGFSVHSMVDTFTLTTSILPILIYSAYVVGINHTKLPETPKLARSLNLRRWIPIPIIVISIAYFVWFLKLDSAQYNMSLSIQSIANDDLPSALHYADRAREIDPQLGLYNLHYAYVLGLMADENPTQYLDQAIQAHVTALENDLTFDLFHINLAALYLQRGGIADYASAVDHIEQAIALNAGNGDYYLQLGKALEQQAISEGLNPVTQRTTTAYHNGIQRIIYATGSPFWDNSLSFAARSAALETFYEETTPTNQLLIAVQRNWLDRATMIMSEIENQTNFQASVAQGDYALYLIGDNDLAIRTYTQAIEIHDVGLDTLAPIYVKRAEAYLRLGDSANAEHDARTALFLDAKSGARGNYILALIEINQHNAPIGDETVNQLLIDSIAPRTIIQYYASVVYLRPAAFDYLPQVQILGFAPRTYDPWFLLAERYATDNNPNTDPQTVYDAIQREAPYMQIP